MTIGDQFEKIMQSKIANMPIDDIGEVFAEGVREDTRRGIDPTGKEYDAYSTNTNKNGTVTMRDHQRGIENTSFRKENSMSGQVELRGMSGKSNTKSHKPTESVFYRHQYGKARGGKVRKVFPEKEDQGSAGVQEKVNKVELILEEYFNE